MERLTTVALIERRVDITRSLFTRYWRDVHGVMAARIPGFETYTQYHVTPLADVGTSRGEPFEGVALVTFTGAAQRAGLANSDISQYIQRDERNVFRRALLYNLEAGASSTRLSGASHAVGPPWVVSGSSTEWAQESASAFLLVPADDLKPDAIVRALGRDGALELHVHDLTSGDPSAWNQTDIDDGGAGRRFVAIVHGRWRSSQLAIAAIEHAVDDSHGTIPAYRVDHTFVMVDRGVPTALGLRGWDALQTILEAGATNQLDSGVTRAIYGFGAAQARSG